MPGKFVVKQTKKGYRFSLLATNGRVIATSDVYPTRRNCLQGVESVRKNAPGATLVEGSAPARRPARAASKATAGDGTPRRAAARATVKTAAATTGAPRTRQAKAPVAAAATKRAGRTKKAGSTASAR